MIGSRNLAEGEPSAGITVPSADVRPMGPFRVSLKTRPEFQRAGRGRRTNVRSLGLQAFKRPDGDDPAPRFGLTVTKRVGNAVERNRIKRRLRAVLRGPGVAPEAGHDYVIVARREALAIPFYGLVADLVKALDQSRPARSSQRQNKPSGRQNALNPSP